MKPNTQQTHRRHDATCSSLDFRDLQSPCNNLDILNLLGTILALFTLDISQNMFHLSFNLAFKNILVPQHSPALRTLDLVDNLDHTDTIKVSLYVDNPDHMAGILQDTVDSHQTRWDHDQE